MAISKKRTLELMNPPLMASLPTQLVESHWTDSASVRVLPLVAVDLLLVLQIVFPLELDRAY